MDENFSLENIYDIHQSVTHLELHTHALASLAWLSLANVNICLENVYHLCLVESSTQTVRPLELQEQSLETNIPICCVFLHCCVK